MTCCQRQILRHLCNFSSCARLTTYTQHGYGSAGRNTVWSHIGDYVFAVCRLMCTSVCVGVWSIRRTRLFRPTSRAHACLLLCVSGRLDVSTQCIWPHLWPFVCVCDCCVGAVTPLYAHVVWIGIQFFISVDLRPDMGCFVSIWHGWCNFGCSRTYLLFDQDFDAISFSHHTYTFAVWRGIPTWYVITNSPIFSSMRNAYLLRAYDSKFWPKRTQH